VNGSSPLPCSEIRVDHQSGRGSLTNTMASVPAQTDREAGRQARGFCVPPNLSSLTRSKQADKWGLAKKQFPKGDPGKRINRRSLQFPIYLTRSYARCLLGRPPSVDEFSFAFACGYVCMCVTPPALNFLVFPFP